ncbi:MAG: PASTA domain-containing protein, partial [Ruminococcus sp.]
ERREPRKRVEPEEIKKKEEPVDFDNDEKEEKKERSQKQSIAIGIVASFLICLVGFGVYFLVHSLTGGSADTAVPNYVGRTIVDIKQDSDKNDFNFDIEFEYDSTKKEGVVLSQKPEADSKMVKQGATIQLTVNGKNSQVVVPHLLNTTEEDAIKQLESRSLVPEIVYIRSDDVNTDYVSSEFPNPGEKTTIGSTIYLYVSKGPAPSKVKIPDVTGKKLEEAREELEKKGLEVEYEYDENSYEEKDTVIRQNPLQGGTVKKGYTVKLVLSAGKKDTQSIDIEVELPKDETNSVSLQVVFDGDVFVTTNVVPSELKVYKFTLTGSESDSNVKVYLNGQLYQEYAIDFQNKTASPTYHEYKVATTPTETTEETTASEVEPTTEYSVPEVSSTQPVTRQTNPPVQPTTLPMDGDTPE